MKLWPVSLVVLVGLVAGFVALPQTPVQPDPVPTAPQTATITRSFVEDFSREYVVRDASEPEKSTHPDWWLSSGGYFTSREGRGETVLNALPARDERRLAYAKTNAQDAADGYRPQNIFRLVQRGIWKEYTQEVFFTLGQYEVSQSPERNASNGVFLFNRYVTADTLYYTGIRVDGHAVIKKKLDGVYYTMAYRPLGLDKTYNRDLNPNLLPLNTKLGLKSVVTSEPDGSVRIQLYVDMGSGTWRLIAQAIDDGVRFGGPALLEGGHAGIRTDFFDVLFSHYAISESSFRMPLQE